MEQSTLYVDVENLQSVAKQALISVIEHWPPGFPTAKRVRLYVEADQAELWHIWATHYLPSVEVAVKGVQHFTLNGSKNSADIALALDVIADLLKGRTTHVAIMSDDSDFTTLFSVVRQEITHTADMRVPFMWFMTDRTGTRSQMLGDFFPSEYIFPVACTQGAPVSYEKDQMTLTSEPENEAKAIAICLMRNLPVGVFKSADCKKLMTKYFPKCSWGKTDLAAFGNKLSELVWPVLQTYGVELQPSTRGSRKYFLTDQAKKKAEQLSN